MLLIHSQMSLKEHSTWKREATERLTRRWPRGRRCPPAPCAGWCCCVPPPTGSCATPVECCTWWPGRGRRPAARRGSRFPPERLFSSGPSAASGRSNWPKTESEWADEKKKNSQYECKVPGCIKMTTSEQVVESLSSSWLNSLMKNTWGHFLLLKNIFRIKQRYETRWDTDRHDAGWSSRPAGFFQSSPITQASSLLFARLLGSSQLAEWWDNWCSLPEALKAMSMV